MGVEINVIGKMYIEGTCNGESYKILTGLPGSVYLIGGDIAQYFSIPERSSDMSTAKLRSIFPDINTIERSAQLYTGGQIDLEQLTSSIDSLIKNRTLGQKDKKFIMLLAKNHDKDLPDAFGFLLSQNGYSKHFNSIKFKSRDPRFKHSCEVFNLILNEISQAIKKTRLEEIHGSTVR